MTESVLEGDAAAARLRAGRDFVLGPREDETACRGFRWPELVMFNWRRAVA